MARNGENPITDLPEGIQDELLTIAGELWNRPEPGFFETRTHDYLAGKFAELGLEVETFEGIPGFVARSPGAVGSDRVALVADMDALPNPTADDETYIHSCGHHMQTAALYGSARILGYQNSAVLKAVDFIATPAEEYIDFDRRSTLREEGRVQHLSGKQELLHRGLFEKYRRVVSTHAAGITKPLFISSVRGMGGFEVLRFRFTGKAAHAGAKPHEGVNAQNAASLFLQAAAFLREGFDEKAHIRIHPVVSLPAGQSVNIIPETAAVETYVRAADPESITSTGDKLVSAAEGCARAIGASVEVDRKPGYAPFKADIEMHETLRSVVEDLGIPFIEEEYSAASSDMGDVSQAVPSIMLGLPGVNGLFHNPQFRVTDEEAAYLVPSVVLARYLESLAGE